MLSDVPLLSTNNKDLKKRIAQSKSYVNHSLADGKGKQNRWDFEVRREMNWGRNHGRGGTMLDSRWNAESVLPLHGCSPTTTGCLLLRFCGLL